MPAYVTIRKTYAQRRHSFSHSEFDSRNQFLGYCNIDSSDRLTYFPVASTTNDKLLSDERSITCVKKRIHGTCLTELIEADCKGCILCST